MSDYKIQPMTIDDDKLGTFEVEAVVVNRDGEWSAMIDFDGEGNEVAYPFSDNGPYVEAPHGWRERIVEEL